VLIFGIILIKHVHSQSDEKPACSTGARRAGVKMDERYYCVNDLPKTRQTDLSEPETREDGCPFWWFIIPFK